MELIDRQNVLDLIGKDSRRYHSCIITCYSFDFSFFEERVLPVFRTANIRNVNVFADGKCLENSQELTTGKEFSFQKNYSLISIYNDQGVFHPKILFLVGELDSLLIIGSGNITSSGLHHNDEIWAAFHYKDGKEKNSSIINEAWLYLNSLFKFAKGISVEKLKWISSNANWLDDLKLISKNTNPDVRLITNNFYNTILDELPKKELKKITIVSPYYDQKGKLIENLYNDLEPERMKVLIEENSGILPYDFPFHNYLNIDFYSWKNSKLDFDDSLQKLHAKLIHFEYSDEEFLFFGSANATISGLGSREINAVNMEASIMISRDIIDNNNWIRQLGIVISDEQVDIKALRSQKPLKELNNYSKNLLIRLLYAEQHPDKVLVTATTLISTNYKIVFLNRDEIIIDEFNVEKESEEINISFQDQEVFKIYVKYNNERISNCVLVHNVINLLKTNPNQLSSELEQLLNTESIDGDGLESLLRYTDTDWADEIAFKSKASSNFSYGFPVREQKETEKNDLKKLEYHDFNNSSVSTDYDKYTSSQNPNIRIADFFISLSRGLAVENNYDESEELRLVIDDSESDGGNGKVAVRNFVDNAIQKKKQKAIFNYLIKIERFLLSKANSFINSDRGFNDLTMLPIDYLNITIFSKYVIAIKILLKYQRDKILNEDNLIEKTFINPGNLNAITSLKGFLLKILGLNFLSFSKGFTIYENEYLNKKYEQYKCEFLEGIVQLIISMNWTRKEKTLLPLMILNLMKYFGSDAFNKYKKEFEKENLAFLNVLIDDFKEWNVIFMKLERRKKYLIVPVSRQILGKIIYNSNVGFGFLKAITENGFITLECQAGIFTLPIGKSCVVFESVESEEV